MLAESLGDAWPGGLDGLDVDLELKNPCEELGDPADAGVPFRSHCSECGFVLAVPGVHFHLVFDQQGDDIGLSEEGGTVWGERV